MPFELVEYVTLAFVVLALTCHGIIFLRTDARVCLQCACSSVAAVVRCLRSWSSRLEKDDTRSGLVVDEVASQLVRNMRMAQSIIRHGYDVAIVIRLSSVFSYQNPALSNPMHLWVTMGTFFISVVLHVFPWLINPKTLGFWHSVYMVLISSAVVNNASTDPEYHLVLSKVLLGCRLLLAWAYQRPSAVIFWNLVVSMVWTLSNFAVDASHRVLFLWHELVIAAFVILLNFAMYNSTWTKADYKLQQLMLNGEVSAMTRLLNLVCDVAVELDSSLKVVTGLPRLKAFLTLDGGNSSGYDVTLQQYMPNDDDKQRYQDLLLSSGEDAAGVLPGALKVSMRDCLNSVMCIQVFYVHFRDPNGGSRYLVGLQEDKAPSVAPLRSFPRRNGPPSTTQRGGSSQQRRRRSRVASDELSSESSPAGSDSSSAGSDTKLSEGDNHRAEGTLKSARRGRRLLAPYSRETSEWARTQTILQMLETWSVHEKLPLECCQFHSTMKVLKSTMGKMTACDDNFKPFGEMQCTACGIIGKAEDGDGDQECCLCVEGTIVRQSRKTSL